MSERSKSCLRFRRDSSHNKLICLHVAPLFNKSNRLLAGVIPASLLLRSTGPGRAELMSRVAERVGLLAAGDGRSSSASLRTDAFASSKIAPQFCRTWRVLAPLRCCSDRLIQAPQNR